MGAMKKNSRRVVPRISKRGRVNEGRPTYYKPEYCQRLMAFFDVPAYATEQRELVAKNGETIYNIERIPVAPPQYVTFYQGINISRDTFYEWIKRYPEFADAYKMCQEHVKRIYETNAALGLYNPSWSIFAAKNRLLREDGTRWSDRAEVDHTTKGKALPGNLDLSNMPTAQLESILSALAAAEVIAEDQSET
jgi:hypothetical protein